MKFCQNCDNLLYLKINDKKTNESSEDVSESTTSGDDMPNTDEPCELKYICRMCNEEYKSTEADSCVFNINFNLDNTRVISTL